MLCDNRLYKGINFNMELISFLCVGVIFSVLVEIFITSPFTKKALYSALSLIIIYLCVSGLKSTINNTSKETDLFVSSKIEESFVSLSTTSVKQIKQELNALFKAEGYTNTEVEEIEYTVQDLSVQYISIVINTNGQVVNRNDIVKIVNMVLPKIPPEGVILK